MSLLFTPLRFRGLPHEIVNGEGMRGLISDFFSPGRTVSRSGPIHEIAKFSHLLRFLRSLPFKNRFFLMTRVAFRPYGRLRKSFLNDLVFFATFRSIFVSSVPLGSTSRLLQSYDFSSRLTNGSRRVVSRSYHLTTRSR